MKIHLAYLLIFAILSAQLFASAQNTGAEFSRQTREKVTGVFVSPTGVESVVVEPSLKMKKTERSSLPPKNERGTVYINSCRSLNQANTEYVLTVDVTSQYDCFEINAQNVTLDCAGHSMRSTTLAQTYKGVRASSQVAPTVKNCVIVNYTKGVYFSGVTGGRIENNIISNAAANGGTAMGINLRDNSQNNLMENNVIDSYGTGLWVYQSAGNTLHNNYARSARGNGIWIYQSPSTTLKYNTAIAYANSGQYAPGLAIGSSQNSVLGGNTGNSTESFGIDVGDSDSCILSDNAGFSAQSVGLGLYGSSYCQVSETNVVGANGIGFYSSANYNTVRKNFIRTNGGIGIYFEDSVAGSNNVIAENLITANVWVKNHDASNLFSSDGHGNGYFFSDGSPSWMAYDIVDWTCDCWAEVGAARPFSSATVGAHWNGVGQDSYPVTLVTVRSPPRCCAMAGITGIYPKILKTMNETEKNADECENQKYDAKSSATAASATKCNGNNGAKEKKKVSDATNSAKNYEGSRSVTGNNNGQKAPGPSTSESAATATSASEAAPQANEEAAR